MKKIECVIRADRLIELENKLNDHVSGMTVSYVKGCGMQKGETQIYRGAPITVTLISKIKVEIVVPDEKVDDLVEIIRSVCYTGKIGDGKIFILHVEDVVRIRTGEKGLEALYGKQ